MSTSETTADGSSHEESPGHGPAGGHAHPSDGRYWIIAAVLGGVTAIEVFLSYAHWLGAAVGPLLLIGMAVKFFLVASFFMHLRFDSKPLRRLFIAGLFLALFCYIGAIAMFRDFGPRDHRQEIHFTPSGIPQS